MSEPTLRWWDAQAGDPAWIREMLSGVFEIGDITIEEASKAALGARTMRLRGHFLIDTSIAYARLAPRFRERGYTIFFRREKDEEVIRVVYGTIKATPNNRWLPVVLAAVTVLSVLFSYVLFWESPEPTLTGILQALPRGWGFALSLLGILLAHETAHYLTARHLGVAVTWPYLIPFPLSPFGTLGAVIRMKDIPPSKRAMVLIGAAGPLTGLVVAIPVLLYGLSLSTVGPLPTMGGYSLEGNSLLYAALKFISFGRLLPAGGQDVNLHPIAFAGWAGLLVTALNLIPAGQLDGGHIAYALLGHKARYLTWALIIAILALGIWWYPWFLWAVLIFFFSRSEVPPMDDLTPLRPGEVALAVVLLIIFILTFTPLPLQFINVG